MPEPEADTVATVLDARPAAMVDGRTVAWGDLKPIVTELAGARALEETILDRRLEQLAAERGIVLSPDAATAEQRRLLEMLDDDASRALRLLDDLRQREGLGPTRYRKLLRRNAILRALVQDKVSPSADAVDRMYDTMYGETRQVRLLVVPTLAQAERAIIDVAAGAFFGDIVVSRSSDLSASRGGLLAPVSRMDPAYPAALRNAIWRLRGPGDMSSPILIENGYAVVQLVREREASGQPREEVQDRLERLVRLSQERILMDQLARRLVNSQGVTIFDESLKEGWARRQR